MVFLVRMNVGVEKVSDGLLPFFSDSLKGIDGTVGTTDMKENFRFAQTSQTRLITISINSLHSESQKVVIASPKGVALSLFGLRLLHGVYPELTKGILRFAQNDKRRRLRNNIP